MAVGLTIGQLAKAAGVTVETIRYYQRRSLLIEPSKPLGGHRRYPQEMVRRLHFIKRAQALGFTLSEVEDLLALDGASACSATRALAAHKREAIEKKIDDLAAMRGALDRLIRQCDQGGGKAGCPTINTLDRD
ncbi:Hg(II)-responsive transcriptional regulator [Pseudomonas zhanjiangensis]|uniref:Mercuric resistance operon regulatory protein n=1 Tax=Pseudomonas zhanjiangensis TaxID=3239015 RepID=A0ABV3Z0G3_9PSED